ncbi:hypothetical protein COU76_00095 [Candidatus Peregrinibacteria bacterium CG10_big_fil_rev_8_21_14_0_10_49_10]|nr:MAG: hypothetical protein COU76_00095 [Candidatus Peregrinibacteria bacterium CG10_big_fil_rev_8_21_14_0_10_49_10]
MIKHLQKLTAVLFFSLGSTFFASYLLLQNGLSAPWPEWWLSVADLPMILCALLYGGSSLYLSVAIPKKKSIGLALCIGIPLAALFLFCVVLNYWEVFGFPGEAVR